MAAPKGSSDSGSTAVIVMIIFIVLFLISAGTAIGLYVNIETCNKKANDANGKLSKLGNASQISEVERLAQSSGLDSGTTFAKLEAVLKNFSEMIIGGDQANFSISNAKANIDSSISMIWPEVAQALGQEEEQVVAGGLVGAVTSLTNALNETTEQFTMYQDQASQQLLLSQQKVDQYQERINQLQADIDNLGMTVANMKNQTDDNIDDIRGRFESHVASLQEEKEQIVKETQEYRQQLDKELEQAAQLSEKAQEMEKFLRDTRQKPTTEIEALDPDGKIISVDPREHMVYINLAQNDKIYRGLTFSVYDGLDKNVPSSGQGKATIEVIEILDSISRCRVVESLTTNPIIKGDVIANLVWDKQKEFVFCLVGDFDFNMDGEIDIDGRDRIATLIKAWGGKVQDYVGVETDFLVYGFKPASPSEGGAFISGSEDNQANIEQAEERALMYDLALDEGVRLGVPSFNMDRFFRFIGYSEKQVAN